MLISMKEILQKAKEEKYAVAAYNVNNLEWAKFILEASMESKSPAILEVSESAIKYMGGFNVTANMVKSLIKDLNIKVPVALHLDHGKSVEACKEAIDAGFTSVMIDASQYPLEENIKITKEVVKYAHAKNVSVEAEVGAIANNSNADIDECIRLVNETNVDFLAPAVGTVHGLYKEEPNINFDLLLDINKKVGVPLVLHGGTGIADEMLLKAVECGICKVNINTQLQVSWSNAVRKFLNDDPNVYDPRIIIKSGEMALKNEVITKNILLGSSNKTRF